MCNRDCISTIEKAKEQAMNNVASMEKTMAVYDKVFRW